MPSTSIVRSLSFLDQNFERYAIGVLITSMLTILVVDLVTRTVGIALDMPWKQTIVTGLLIWAIWIGLAWGVKLDSHFRFLAVRERFTPRMHYASYVVEWATWFLFIGTVLWYSQSVMHHYVQAGAIVGTSLPRYLLYAAIPVGLVLVGIRVVQRMVVITRQYLAGESIGLDTTIFED